MKLAIYSDLHCEFETWVPPLEASHADAYASNLEQDIIEMKDYPVLWVLGHSHNNVDYTIGNTRVLSNQRGYSPSHLNENFDEHLIVHI